MTIGTKLLVLIAVLAVAAAAAWLFVLPNGTATGLNTASSIVSGTQTQKQDASQGRVNASSTVKEFDIEAFQFGFEPSTITVNNGDRVRIRLTSRDVTHGFSIMQFNVKTEIEPGKTSVVEFTANKSGNFTFFCSFYCGDGHSEQNGQLIVK